jgi:hypothetical protein
VETITAREILRDLKGRWPFCSCEIGDPLYYLPSIAEWQTQFKRTDIDKWDWSGAFKCNAFCAVLRGWEAQRIVMDNLDLAWPLAEVRGYFYGVNERHAMALCWCKEGMRFAEPQTDQMRPVDPSDRVESFWL